MATTRRDLYRSGAHVWLTFSDHGDGDELYEACESKPAAVQALDERLNCCDLRDWAVSEDWRVKAIDPYGPRRWIRTIRNSSTGQEGSQSIRKEPVRVELHSGSGDQLEGPGNVGVELP